MKKIQALRDTAAALLPTELSGQTTVFIISRLSHLICIFSLDFAIINQVYFFIN